MKKKLFITGGVIFVLLIAAVLVVGMSLGSIIKRGVERVGPTITKTEVKLGSADLSILSGSGTLKGFLLGNPEGYKTPSAIKAGSLSVGVQPRSLFADKVHVTHVRVEGAEITFEGTLGTANNLSKLLDNVKGASNAARPAEKPVEKPRTPAEKTADRPATEPKSSGASKKLQVDEFTLTGAKLNLSMTLLGGKALTVPLPEIKWTGLGTGPEGITAAELTEQVLERVTLESFKAVEKAMVDLGKNATDIATKSAKDALDKATKGGTGTLDKATKNLGDLFKKM